MTNTNFTMHSTGARVSINMKKDHSATEDKEATQTI